MVKTRWQDKWDKCHLKWDSVNTILWIRQCIIKMLNLEDQGCNSKTKASLSNLKDFNKTQEITWVCWVWTTSQVAQSRDKDNRKTTVSSVVFMLEISQIRLLILIYINISIQEAINLLEQKLCSTEKLLSLNYTVTLTSILKKRLIDVWMNKVTPLLMENKLFLTKRKILILLKKLT